jgi:hypothetical protein
MELDTRRPPLSLLAHLPLVVLAAVLAAFAWIHRVYESLLLLLPARRTARPTGLHMARRSLSRRAALTSE